MSDGISDGLGGHRDWQTLWTDWDKERRQHWEYRSLYEEQRKATEKAEAESAALRRERDALVAERETLTADLGRSRMESEAQCRRATVAEETMQDVARVARLWRDEQESALAAQRRAEEERDEARAELDAANAIIHDQEREEGVVESLTAALSAARAEADEALGMLRQIEEVQREKGEPCVWCDAAEGTHMDGCCLLRKADAARAALGPSGADDAKEST
jgi:hypothetical protein